MNLKKFKNLKESKKAASRDDGEIMLRKLRIKFICICMVLVTILVSLMIYTSFISARRNLEAVSADVLNRAMHEKPSNKKEPPDFDFNQKRMALPYFTVDIINGSEYLAGGTYPELENSALLSAILKECLQRDKKSGILERYGLRYLRVDNGFAIKIAFADMSMELATLRRMFASWIVMALAILPMILGLLILLSGWAVEPVAKAWRRQRIFLSDASHELKTPLAVILSNAALLENALNLSNLSDSPALPDANNINNNHAPENNNIKNNNNYAPEENININNNHAPEENINNNIDNTQMARWAGNIAAESRRMKNLVEEMLILARSDSGVISGNLRDVCLSDTAADCALSFETLAFECGKSLRYEIAPDVTVTGDEEKLYRLISILLDNAVKYGAENGVILLSLEKTDKQVKLCVSNPGEPIPPEQLKHLFERFYRADASRSDSTGFGLGLSIAAAIAKEHKGALRVESDEISTRFLFSMPIKK